MRLNNTVLGTCPHWTLALLFPLWDKAGEREKNDKHNPRKLSVLMVNDSMGCGAGCVSDAVVRGLGLVQTHCSGPENWPGALGNLGSASSLVGDG